MRSERGQAPGKKFAGPDNNPRTIRNTEKYCVYSDVYSDVYCTVLCKVIVFYTVTE